jgi:hypothetical protein
VPPRDASVSYSTFFASATMLVLASKTAGWWGLDRCGLPDLGSPRRPDPPLARGPAVSVIR